MRISDWSSDVCSSDLVAAFRAERNFDRVGQYIDAVYQFSASAVTELYLFCCHVPSPKLDFSGIEFLVWISRQTKLDGRSAFNDAHDVFFAHRYEERCVGKECVGTS